MANLLKSIYDTAHAVSNPATYLGGKIGSGYVDWASKGGLFPKQGGNPIKVYTDFFGGNKQTTPASTYKPTGIMSESDYINQYMKNQNIQQSGGGVNLGGLYSAYEQQAGADVNALNQAVGTKKADLATQLQRLRENINASRKAQTEAYQGTRADLEESGFMATRANRASAASRGLSGSGLEQLAQLQQMMKQNKAISKESNINQRTQEGLGKTLLEGEQDYGTNVQNLTNEQQAQLQKINANLASSKASAAQQAASANASAAANYQAQLQAARQNAQMQYTSGSNTAQALQLQYAGLSKTKTNAKAAKDALALELSKGTIDSSLANTVMENLKKYYGKSWK